jgi:hypothetical protein
LFLGEFLMKVSLYWGCKLNEQNRGNLMCIYPKKCSTIFGI